MNQIIELFTSNKLPYFGIFAFVLIILGGGKIFNEEITTVVLLIVLAGVFINIYYHLKKVMKKITNDEMQLITGGMKCIYHGMIAVLESCWLGSMD